VTNILRARGDAGVIDGPVASRPRTPAGAGADPTARFAAAHDLAIRRGDPDVPVDELWRAMADYQAAIDVLLEAPTAPDSTAAEVESSTRSS
jgi:hypothetical protein